VKRRSALALATTVLAAAATVVVGPASAHADPVVGGSAHQINAAEINREITPPGGIMTAATGGNTIGAAVRERVPRSDGYRHIDTPLLVARLKQEGLNTYTYVVWDSPTDWPDLVNEFAPAAEKAGIKVWVYVVPPSECFRDAVPVKRGRCSEPFELDYVAWATAVAQLSVQHPNVVAWAIDDFPLGNNAQLFTPEYMQRMADAQDAINPHLGFYTTAYLGQLTDPNFYPRYAPYIDGVIYPYLGGDGANNVDASEVATNLNAVLAHTGSSGLGVEFLAYTGRFLATSLSPTASYLTKVFDAAQPYLADGRIMGFNFYGLPLADSEGVSADNRAAHGLGRLSLSLAGGVGTSAGNFAQAAQSVTVDPNASSYTLRFVDWDQFGPDVALQGYHIKQVLVDGSVAWSQDTYGPGGETWQDDTVDLTAALRGKTSATLAFRLYEQNGVGDYAIDLGIDDVSGSGFTIRNGGFESDQDWTLSNNTSHIIPSIDLFADHDPSNILRAAAAAVAGQPFSLLPPRGYEAPLTGFSSDRDSMYGDGRLSLSVPANTSTQAGQCATASQVVSVDPTSARYEISFWEYLRHFTAGLHGGAHTVSVTVDSQPIWTNDGEFLIQYLWVNGHTDQGPIDVGDLVRGKSHVTLSFNLCEAKAVTNLGVDVGFDHIQTVGLQVHNPGFENTSGWTLSSAAPAPRALIKIFR
jgi:hypothetical protein